MKTPQPLLVDGSCMGSTHGEASALIHRSADGQSDVVFGLRAAMYCGA